MGSLHLCLKFQSMLRQGCNSFLTQMKTVCSSQAVLSTRLPQDSNHTLLQILIPLNYHLYCNELDMGNTTPVIQTLPLLISTGGSSLRITCSPNVNIRSKESSRVSSPIIPEYHLQLFNCNFKPRSVLSSPNPNLSVDSSLHVSLQTEVNKLTSSITRKAWISSPHLNFISWFDFFPYV